MYVADPDPAGHAGHVYSSVKLAQINELTRGPPELVQHFCL
jgi:hypothetical protein